MYNMCFVKNIDSSPAVYCGQEFAPGFEYLVQDHERIRWSTDEAILSAILHDKLQIGNSAAYIQLYSDQIDWLKSRVVAATVTNLGPADAVGRHSLVATKPAGSSYAITSHNLVDRCTWFSQSVKVTDAVLTLDSGTTYASAHDYWIDLTHARHYLEDRYSAYYPVVIKIDDVVQTSGYTVNYEAGTVTFDEAPSGVVKATYNYENGSAYILAPSSSGKRLMIEHTEVQFSVNVTIPKPIVFEVWVYNPYDLPNKVMYEQIKYKSAKDFINSGNLGQGLLHHFGELTQDVVVIPYQYVTVTPLASSTGTELRIRVEDDVALTGELGTVTFYVYEEDEE